jgi:Protein of unknown function (DUF2845)
MKRFARFTSVLLLIAFPTATSPALGASSWQCGSRLVGPGQSTSDVYALCGEPTDRVASTEFVTFHARRGLEVTRAVFVERWRYDLGPRRFVRYLTFRDGRLVDIGEGGYGF